MIDKNILDFSLKPLQNDILNQYNSIKVLKNKL